MEARPNKKFCSDLCRTNFHRQKKIEDFKSDGFYYLYYLPEEHYIGVSNDPKRRTDNHKSLGKIINGWEIVFKSKNPKLVAYYESLLHLIGYEGSNYDRMIRSRKKMK